MNVQDKNNIESDWEAQLLDYSMGSMEPGAAATFERQLDECRQHVALAQEYMGAAHLLALSVKPAEPPVELKSKLMAAIASTPQETTPVVPAQQPQPAVPKPAPTNVIELSKKRRLPVWPTIASAAAVLALLLGFWGWSAQQRADKLDTMVNEFRQTLSVPPEWQAFPVTGQGQQPNSWAACLINPKTNEAFLVANNLQPLTPDKVYELWWLPADSSKPPLPAGVFSADKSGKAQLKADKAPDGVFAYVGVAVTIEKAPGVNRAQGPIVLVGNYEIH